MKYKNYYAARATEYDQIYLKPERQSDLREIERWLPTVFAGSSVLEIACGTGYWTQFIAPAASHVLAIDAARETMRIAKGRVPKEKVKFVVGDAYALPVVDGMFERGFAGFWISHVPKSRIREFLLGFHKALRPGAKVVLLDNRFVEGSSSPISGHDAEGNTYQARPLRDGTTHRVLKNFPSESELRAVTEGLCNDVKYKVWQYFWRWSMWLKCPNLSCMDSPSAPEFSTLGVFIRHRLGSCRQVWLCHTHTFTSHRSTTALTLPVAQSLKVPSAGLVGQN